MPRCHLALVMWGLFWAAAPAAAAASPAAGDVESFSAEVKIRVLPVIETGLAGGSS